MDDSDLMTIAEAARLADRSKTVVRRWVMEGFVPLAYKVPGRNGSWLISRTQFTQDLPGLLEEMASRRGGRGKKATDAAGNVRVTKEA